MDYASIAINNLFMKEAAPGIVSKIVALSVHTNEHLLFNKTAGVCKSRYLIIYFILLYKNLYLQKMVEEVGNHILYYSG